MLYHKRLSLLAIPLVLLLIITGCGNNNMTTDQPVKTAQQQPLDNSQLNVHFLDVGQADSILVQLPNGENMLIDAGNNDDGELVTSYLKDKNISKINYLVGTHPHEDHIGGLDDVINHFDIGMVYLPKVSHTTKTYEDVLIALKNKGLKVVSAKSGVKIINEKNLQATILSPISKDYEELNNYSAVIKLSYQDTSFLFTGDAEQLVEDEILTSGANVNATVLKVGHHGSVSSTSDEFLAKVNPKVAVISVGKNNDYGHPHIETLEKLSYANINILRTDQQGTIILQSDGKQVSSINAPIELVSTSNHRTAKGSYLGSVNSDKYHTPDCPHVNSIAEKNIIWFKNSEEASKAGYQPCSNIK